MDVREYFDFIVNRVHTVVLATVDAAGRPVTCAADMMDYDENGLYFLTAKGKQFYARLKGSEQIAFTAMKGKDTLSCTAVSVQGKAEEIGTDKLTELFRKNPYTGNRQHCFVRAGNVHGADPGVAGLYAGGDLWLCWFASRSDHSDCMEEDGTQAADPYGRKSGPDGAHRHCGCPGTGSRDVLQHGLGQDDCGRWNRPCWNCCAAVPCPADKRD